MNSFQTKELSCQSTLKKFQMLLFTLLMSQTRKAEDIVSAVSRNQLIKLLINFRATKVLNKVNPKLKTIKLKVFQTTAFHPHRKTNLSI
mgnify:CR=1 FL=1